MKARFENLNLRTSKAFSPRNSAPDATNRSADIPPPALKVLAAVGCAGLVLATARDAHAYLDAGTGSYILQALVAGLLGAGFAIKTFWRNIKVFFSRIFGMGKDSPDGT